MEGNFKEHAQHLEGCAVRLATADSSFASFGSDDAVFTLDLRSQRTESHTLDNPDREEITALAIDPRNMNSFVVGTASGCVRRLWPVHQYRLREATLMYKCDRPIKMLSFHPKGKFLGIATEDEQAIVYSILDKRVITLQRAHEGGAVNVFFAGGYVCSQGLEGYLHLYQFKLPSAMEASDDSDSEEPQGERPAIECPFMDRYKISTDGITRRHPYFNAAYAEFRGDQPEKVVLASGQTCLQIIELEGRSSNYRIERAIREQEEILLVQVLSEGERGLPNCLVTSSASFLSIWNYTIKQKLFAISTAQIFKGCVTAMVRTNSPEGPSFFFAINHNISSGKIYQFVNPSILNGPPLPELQQADAIQTKPKKEKTAFVSKWDKEAQLDNLIPDFTQHLLEKSYEQSQGARFLFYNSEGCVIERTDGGNSNIQLELHDKSKHKRIKLDVRNRPIWMFALRQDVLVYASGNSVVFQCERHLREGHEGWEFKWDNIQAVAIGNCWVAVCSSDAVKILDYSGNELHTFCFDRRLVAFEAYEDTLAVTFHSALPLWRCQALKVRIYRITPDTVTIERDTMLPLKANSHLKWFGFSEEGMLYCQDTFEVLRGYLFDRDEWVPVHSLDFTAERLFIQHISGSNIYGFKMEQKGGRSEEPKVTPRSLPRRFPMELPALPLPFLTKEEDAHFRRLRLRNIQLEHERFRYHRWYKLKYSRGKNNIWYSVSESILSAEELRTACTHIDYQLLDHLKKFARRWEDKRSREFEQAARSLMLILHREAHFPDDTLNSARDILEVRRMQKSQIHDDGVVVMRHGIQGCKTKLKEMNMLEKMMNVMNVI